MKKPDVSQVEDASARTRMSRTLLDPVTATRITQLGSQALNYQDTKGGWQPIDNKLTAVTGGGWTNGANAYSVSLPADLSKPVAVADSANSAASVSLQLAPAKTPVADLPPVPGVTVPVTIPVVSSVNGKASGAAATYPGALPGVDVAYTAEGDAVKETATLASLATTDALPGASLTYTVHTGGGLTLQADPKVDGAINVLDSHGDTAFVIPPAVMNDDNGTTSSAVTTTLTADKSDPTTWTLTLTPDHAWLAAAGRAWPVVVDPTIGYPSAMAGCTLDSAAPTTSACSGTELATFYNSTGGAEKRALLRFDTLLDVIPADAQIAIAQLNVYVVNDASAVASQVNVRALTSPFTTSATWNKRDSTNNWTTAGGDRSSTVYEQDTLYPNGSYQVMEVSRLVQEWAQGDTIHNGFILQKQAAASGGQLIRLASPSSGNAPSLYVIWAPRTGNRKGNSSAVTEALSDRTSVTVNPATGNAAVTTKELNIAGAGLDVTAATTSQSLDTAGLGPQGYGWTSSLSGTRLQPFNGGTAGNAQTLFYTDGAGGEWTWLRNKNVATTWTRPNGLDMDLDTSGGIYTLTDRKNHVVEKFKNIGTTTNETWGLDTVADKNGNKITFNYDASARSSLDNTLILRSVTDTRGRTLTVTNSAGTFNSYITDSASRNVLYDVNSTTNNLDKITDAAGGLVKYEYDSAHRVTAVVTPENQRTEMSYDGTGRITQLKHISTALGNPTWGFAYTAFTRTGGVPATKTTVTDPNGHDTVYTSDGKGRNGEVKNALGKSTTKTYSPNDDVKTTVGATGGGTQTSTSAYETTGDTYRLTSTAIPTGAGFTVNSWGSGGNLYNVASQTDTRGQTTTFDYDPAGNKTKTTRQDGTWTRNLYEGDTDPDYSSAVVHCGPGGAATKAGALCETRDAEYVAGTSRATTSAHRTAYTYNANGELVTAAPPSGGSLGNQTFTYDGLSRLQTITDGKNQQTYYGYDALDRLTYVLHNDSTTESYYFGPTANNGWLRSLTEYPPTGPATRTTSYGRDDLGRLTAVTAPEGTTALSWDKGSNLSTYDDNGGTITYGYNNADQLSSLQLPGGNCTGLTYASPGSASNLCVLFNNDDDGRRTGTKYPGGTSVQTNYLDNSGRPSHIVATTGSTPVSRLDVAYDYTSASTDTGLVNKATDYITGKTTTYTHDGQDRLTIASTAPTAGGAVTGFEEFCYDKTGNRTKYYTASGATCATASPAASYTYDTANELTGATGVTPTGAAFAGTSFSYDANGNETAAKSAIGRTTAYGDRDQATSFTPAGGSAVTQTYSATGNKDRVTSGTTTFLNSPLAAAPSRSVNGSTSTWAVRDPKGKLIAVRIGPTSTPTTATNYFPFTDNLDNVRALVTATGTTPDVAYTYSVYGAITSTTGALVQPYRYGGGYTDSATNLIKLGVRYYDPTHGRFTQHDPTGQETNYYAYAMGRPETSTDPSGSISTCAAIANLCHLTNFLGGYEKEVARDGVACVGGSLAPHAESIITEFALSATTKASGYNCVLAVASRHGLSVFGVNGASLGF